MCSTANKDLVDDGQQEAGIYHSLRRLFREDKYADLTIRCGGREFKAHRAILCPQSSFFAKACDSGFKESLSGVVELPEDDPEVLARFLQFIYTGDYEDGECQNLDQPSFSACMRPEDVIQELEQAPGIETGGLAGDQSGSLVNRTRSVGDDDDGCVDGDDDSMGAGYFFGDDDSMGDDDGNSGSNDDYDSDQMEQDDALSEAISDEEHSAEDENGQQGDMAGKGGEMTTAEVEQYHRRPNNLLTSLRVYVMADKFDVPALKLLARHRFYMTAREVFATDDNFPAVVDELYETTAWTDKIMREIPCRLIAASIAYDVSDSLPFEPVMRKYADLAVGVLHYSRMYFLSPHCPSCLAKQLLKDGDI